VSTPEADFVRELEIFRTEADAAVQFFYAWQAIHAVAGVNQRVTQALNQTPLFWNTTLGALQTATLIVVGRVFDPDPNSHNVSRLLRLGQEHLEIFSKPALAARKRQGSRNADEWLPGYLRTAYEPTIEDFRRLKRYVANRRKIYEATYRPLRHKVFAHKERMERADVDALFAGTNLRELQKLLVFLRRLHDALWELLQNGRKPNLRPARYSVRRMREQPSAEHRRSSVQERLTYEVERALQALARGS
jgi:hypothetical protein